MSHNWLMGAAGARNRPARRGELPLVDGRYNVVRKQREISFPCRTLFDRIIRDHQEVAKPASSFLKIDDACRNG